MINKQLKENQNYLAQDHCCRIIILKHKLCNKVIGDEWVDDYNVSDPMIPWQQPNHFA